MFRIEISSLLQWRWRFDELLWKQSSIDLLDFQWPHCKTQKKGTTIPHTNCTHVLVYISMPVPSVAGQAVGHWQCRSHAPHAPCIWTDKFWGPLCPHQEFQSSPQPYCKTLFYNLLLLKSMWFSVSDTYCTYVCTGRRDVDSPMYMSGFPKSYIISHLGAPHTNM